MKLLLTSLAITSLGLSSAVSLTQNGNTTQAENNFSGTKKANIKTEREVSDQAMGSAKEDDAPAEHTFEWSDIQIDKAIVPKMDLTRSWLKLDIDYWYSDNSGSGHSDEFNSTESLIITSSDFDSGVRSFENDRHHSGSNRMTDHQWKWQVKVNKEGITIWDWVWVWANGNWGNVATSIAGINIASFEYHFEFYA